MEVISRKEAIEKNEMFYYTGKPCKRGHLAKRYVSSYICRDCFVVWHEENADKVKEGRKVYYEENKAKLLANQREYYTEHKYEYKVWQKQHYLKNRESNIEYAKQYREANHEAILVRNNVRKALTRTEKCKWANRTLLSQAYSKRKILSTETGIEYNVDHIIPLCHLLVCGLHNEFNIRVITQAENLAKHNEFNPETYRHEDYVSFWDELNLT
jgi:hypothetical protein